VPDIIRLNGKFFLYYSVSAWGKQTSAIGLATMTSLDASATNHIWTDCGEVIRSTNGYAYNTLIRVSFWTRTENSGWRSVRIGREFS